MVVAFRLSSVMKKIGYVILTIVTAIFLIIGTARKAPAQQAPTSSIQGFTWSDFNNDGIQNANEPPFVNASIFLDLNTNGVADVGEPVVVTDATGRYEFKDVLTGLYTVRAATAGNATVTFPQSGAANIPFTGLETDNQGLAAWNTDGSGMEPARIGHEIIQSGSYAYYYLASPSYGGINPNSSSSLQGKEPTTGFLDLTKTLTDNGYLLGNISVNLGLVSLGNDIQGQDWFSNGNREIRYYAGDGIVIKVNGEDIIRAPLDRFTLTIDYSGASPLENRISGWADLGVFENISAKSSPKAQAVANAFLRDINNNDTRITFDSLQPAAQLEFGGNGRLGAFFEAQKASFTFTSSPIVSNSGYKIVVEPAKIAADLNFGLGST